MNKSSPEYLRVREEIAKKLCMQSSLASNLTDQQKCAYWQGIHEIWREMWRKKADSLLETQGIAILCDDQILPEPNQETRTWDDYKNYPKAQSDMLKSNFMKVVK